MLEFFFAPVLHFKRVSTITENNRKQPKSTENNRKQGANNRKQGTITENKDKRLQKTTFKFKLQALQRYDNVVVTFILIAFGRVQLPKTTENKVQLPKTTFKLKLQDLPSYRNSYGNIMTTLL